MQTSNELRNPVHKSRVTLPWTFCIHCLVAAYGKSNLPARLYTQNCNRIEYEGHMSIAIPVCPRLCLWQVTSGFWQVTYMHFVILCHTGSRVKPARPGWQSQNLCHPGLPVRPACTCQNLLDSSDGRTCRQTWCIHEYLHAFELLLMGWSVWDWDAKFEQLRSEIWTILMKFWDCNLKSEQLKLEIWNEIWNLSNWNLRFEQFRWNFEIEICHCCPTSILYALLWEAQFKHDIIS